VIWARHAQQSTAKPVPGWRKGRGRGHRLGSGGNRLARPGRCESARKMIKWVRTVLLRQRRNGAVIAEQEPGQSLVWRVAH
jgi:hypothetical protein